MDTNNDLKFETLKEELEYMSLTGKLTYNETTKNVVDIRFKEEREMDLALNSKKGISFEEYFNSDERELLTGRVMLKAGLLLEEMGEIPDGTTFSRLESQGWNLNQEPNALIDGLNLTRPEESEKILNSNYSSPINEFSIITIGSDVYQIQNFDPDLVTGLFPSKLPDPIVFAPIDGNLSGINKEYSYTDLMKNIKFGGIQIDNSHTSRYFTTSEQLGFIAQVQKPSKIFNEAEILKNRIRLKSSSLKLLPSAKKVILEKFAEKHPKLTIKILHLLNDKEAVKTVGNYIKSVKDQAEFQIEGKPQQQISKKDKNNSAAALVLPKKERGI